MNESSCNIVKACYKPLNRTSSQTNRLPSPTPNEMWQSNAQFRRSRRYHHRNQVARRPHLLIVLIILMLLIPGGVAKASRSLHDFETYLGGIPFKSSPDVLEHNTKILEGYLNFEASGSALFVPDKVFHFYPGIFASSVVDFQFIIKGTLQFHRPNFTPDTNDDQDAPSSPDGCIIFENCNSIHITSKSEITELGSLVFDYELDADSHSIAENSPVGFGGHGNSSGISHKRGIIDGMGSDYWGIPFIGYIELGEDRPNLFEMQYCHNTLIEHMIFKNAPLYTINLRNSYYAKIRHTSIIARRTKMDGHSLVDLSAFNTDGLDVSGQHMHGHDIDIWNQDDCIAVKDGSRDMLFERITASGLGLAVGSIGSSKVNNIVFRDSILYNSYKGIFMKFRDMHNELIPGIIEDVTFENIEIVEPQSWGVWIGPAQQAISANVCKANPCSLCWPDLPFTECNGIPQSQFNRITLKDVSIHRPLKAPGVNILGHDTNTIDDLLFHNFLVSPDLPQKYIGLRKTDLFRGLRELDSEPVGDRYLQPGYVTLYVVTFFSLIFLIGLLLTIIFVGIRNVVRFMYRCVTCSDRAECSHFETERSMDTDSSDEEDYTDGDGEIQLTSSIECDDVIIVEEMPTRKWLGVGRCCLSSAGRGRDKSGDADGNGNRNKSGTWKKHRTLLMFNVLILNGIVLVLIFAMMSPMGNVTITENYFVCDGVENATATGETWPVPQCFQDQTTSTIG